MQVSIAVITKPANTGVHWSSTDLASRKLQENLIGFERAPVRHTISHFFTISPRNPEALTKQST